MNSSDAISNGNKTIFIVGPTATGKTDIAHQLALQIGNAEIISADSMQVYKDMDIITAKPSIQMRWQVPYHLLDFVDIDKAYSAADFYDCAMNSIKEILQTGKVPIVVGGTGLYARSLLRGMFSGPSADEGFRMKMRKIADEHGPNYLHDMLKEKDSVAAQRIDPHNVRRIIRALEVFELTGKKISQLQQQWNKKLDEFHPIMGKLYLWGIYRPRKLLYEKINTRIDTMLKQGMIDEIDRLIKRGILNNPVASQALGIKEFSDYFKGLLTKETTVSLLKRNTRRFAKRQLTWFGKEEHFRWFVLYKDTDKQRVVDLMFQEWNRS